MNHSVNEERWLDVLAAKAQPQNAHERKAARLRACFEREEQDIPALTPQEEQRMQQLLATKLAAYQRQQAARPVAQRVPRPSGRPWQAALGWLFGADGLQGARLATLAATVVAVIAVPVTIHLTQEDSQPKSTPAWVIGEEHVISTAQPAEESARLLQVLAQQGVVAQMAVQGEDRVVIAQVPANQQSAVAEALQAEGVALPPSGQLHLRFKKAP